MNVKDTYYPSAYLKDGVEYHAPKGRRLIVFRSHSVFIDPRGHFLMVRCASIRVFDCLMGLLKRRKPLIQFCEFLANFPTL